jgi:hypothetical protein
MILLICDHANTNKSFHPSPWPCDVKFCGIIRNLVGFKSLLNGIHRGSR